MVTATTTPICGPEKRLTTQDIANNLETINNLTLKTGLSFPLCASIFTDISTACTKLESENLGATGMGGASQIDRRNACIGHLLAQLYDKYVPHTGLQGNINVSIWKRELEEVFWRLIAAQEKTIYLPKNTVGHSSHASTYKRISRVGIAEESVPSIPNSKTGMILRPRRQKSPKCINKLGKISQTLVESSAPTDCPSKKRAIRTALGHRLNTLICKKTKFQMPSSVPVRESHQEVIERLCIHLAVRTLHRELRLFLWLGGVPNLASFLAYTRLKAQFSLKEFDVVRVQVLNKQQLQHPLQWLEVGDHDVDRLSKSTQSEHKSFREVLLENLIKRPGKVYDGYVSIMINAN